MRPTTSFGQRGVVSRLAAAFAILAAVAVFPAVAEAPIERFDISAKPITQFQNGADTKKFGPLEFVGGLELTAANADFGALSSMRFLTPGGDFVGVADTGFFFFGTVERDAEQRPKGITNFRMVPMVDESGASIDRKWLVDAEGLDVKDGIATVSFERNHRIAQFKLDPDRMGPAFRSIDYLVPERELRQNKGFETITRAHPYGQHEGGLVIVSERSIDKKGNVFAAIIEGPNKGVFTVRREGDFDITDGAFLPDGDLLLLERSFSIASGVKMRVRRIYGEGIAKGQLADGPVLFEADMRYQIDNMEALEVWQRADGAQMVSLMSDDNHSLFQRNLYLEFILHAD
ncbi:MAG: esterase-like activity of phytase family protein [Rhizobiaceae bacterium]